MDMYTPHTFSCERSLGSHFTNRKPSCLSTPLRSALMYLLQLQCQPPMQSHLREHLGKLKLCKELVQRSCYLTVLLYSSTLLEVDHNIYLKPYRKTCFCEMFQVSVQWATYYTFFQSSCCRVCSIWQFLHCLYNLGVPRMPVPQDILQDISCQTSFASVRKKEMVGKSVQKARRGVCVEKMAVI